MKAHGIIVKTCKPYNGKTGCPFREPDWCAFSRKDLPDFEERKYKIPCHCPLKTQAISVEIK